MSKSTWDNHPVLDKGYGFLEEHFMKLMKEGSFSTHQNIKKTA